MPIHFSPRLPKEISVSTQTSESELFDGRYALIDRQNWIPRGLGNTLLG